MECSLGFDGKILSGKISDTGEKLLYAFYVHKDNEVIHIQNYSSDNELIFDTNGSPGQYYLSCFTMDSAGNRAMAKTVNKSILDPLAPLANIDCSLTFDGKVLTGKIADTGEKLLYAFYVHKNNEVIHVQNYSPDNELIFDTNGEHGLYCLSCFTMDSTGSRGMVKTGFKLIHGPLISQTDLNQIQLSSTSLSPLYLESGAHSFHCLFSRGKTDRLFVMLTAAISRRAGIVSHFNRINSRHFFDGHCLYIADPTLAIFQELDLGWYLGHQDQYVTKDMAMLVSTVGGLLGLDSDRIISYGSSGGGFAAMALANLLPGSCAVAINPQANALDFIPSTVDKLLAYCFDGQSRDEVLKTYPERVDMACALRDTESRMLLVQNSLDHLNWRPHYLRLADTLGLQAGPGPSGNGRHHSIIYSDERGHAPEPVALYREIMEILDTRLSG